jgi:galactonate dehydratase
LDYVQNPEVFNLEEGCIKLFDKPGLGIEIDEKKLQEGQKIGHSWANPIWRNKDGSFAEW